MGGPVRKHLTLGLGSGHDVMVCEFEPRVGLCADSVETAWFSLSPFLSTPPQLAHTSACVLSLSK